MKYLLYIIAIAFSMTGCGTSQNSYDEVVYVSATLMYYETTLEGLEERAENVVRGRVADDAKTINQGYDSGQPTGQYNTVSLEILEVIKGNLTVGDTIKILEPYYIQDGALYTRCNYLPSKPNQEYFFFLYSQLDESKHEGFAGAYFVIHGERGRYLVPDNNKSSIQSYTADDLSLGELATDLYMNLYEDVVKAYMQ